MSLEVFGDGGAEDIADEAALAGWALSSDGLWIHEDGYREPLTDEEMWQWLQEKRDGDQQDYAEWDAQRDD